MTVGFGANLDQDNSGKKPRIKIKFDAINNIIKQYKKIKKYKRSNLFEIHTLQGTEKIVQDLIEDAKENSL